MPAKCRTYSERSESASFCYYLQQTGKPVGNPGASGKLGAVGRSSRSPGAGRGGASQGGPRLPCPVPLGRRSLLAATAAESLRPGRPLALSQDVSAPWKPPAGPPGYS